MWKFVNGSFNRKIKLVCAIIKAVAVQFITALEETQLSKKRKNIVIIFAKSGTKYSKV